LYLKKIKRGLLKMENNFEKEILKKIEIIIKLLTVSSLSSLKEEKQLEKIRTLNEVGFSPKDIAELIRTSSNSVSVALNKLKKKNEEKKEGEDIQPEVKEEKTND